jgi:hypothetical protein
MKIRVPKSSDYQRVRITVSGPNTQEIIRAITEIGEVEHEFADDDALLTVKAQFIDNTGQLVGEEVTLQDAEVIEDELEDELEDEEEEIDEEAPLEDREETVVEEADEPADEPDEELDEVEDEPRSRYSR